MEDENMECHSFEPTWENRDQSPPLEIVVQEFSKYKIKLRYGGYFRLAKNSSTKRYCFGYQKCIYIDTSVYNFDDLIEEVVAHYPSDRGLNFSLWFIEKTATDQSFIKVDSHDKFQVMLSMYEVEKELSVYVTTNNNGEEILMQQRVRGGVDDEESEYSLSDEDYQSLQYRSRS